jgi:hypothetical protein
MTDKFPDLPPEEQGDDLIQAEPMPTLPELPAQAEREQSATTPEILPEIPIQPILPNIDAIDRSAVDSKDSFSDVPVIGPEMRQASLPSLDDSEHGREPAVRLGGELLRPNFGERENRPELPDEEKVPAMLKEILDRVKAMQEKLDTLQVGFG